MTRAKRDERPADRNLREAMEIAKWTAGTTCQCIGKQRKKCIPCVARLLVKRIEKRPGVPQLVAFDTFDTETSLTPHHWIACTDDSRRCNFFFITPSASRLCLGSAIAVCVRAAHGYLVKTSGSCDEARCAHHVPRDAVTGVG